MKTSLPAALLAFSLAAPTLAQAPSLLTAPSPLPIRQVTLFTSGVSYIERGGAVTGDAAVPLTFRTAQINDILKSLTLLDSNGQVQPVVYGARDPIGRTLQAFAVDVRQPQSRAELLNRLRGAVVTVTTSRGALTGQIVSVESKSVTTATGTTTADTLNLLGTDGLQSVRLDEVSGIKLRDARLDRELREALTTLASGSDDQRRSVTLRFQGTGRRDVRVGYIAEAPLWKISYRLLLGTRPYLQGWALVENTSDEDWTNIHLGLVSGRPISFIQDLYQPLYLPRPVVQPDIIASPTPQTHDDNLQADNLPENAPAATLLAPPPAPSPGSVFSEQSRAKATGEVNRLAEGRSSRHRNADGSYSALADTSGAAPSVTAQAQGASAGELFAYNVTTPVTLPRQQAAMIPVVAQGITADKVSLYNADSDPRFPLNAVRLKNTTTLHLKGGPVTLFDGDTYAGDATMEDVPPGDSRLISYAVDLSILGERQDTTQAQTRTTLAVHAGVLTITVRERSETKYTFKSKSAEAKTVLVEHPFDAESKLVQPAAAAERTATVYRFAVPVPAGKAATLQVVTEKPLESTVALFNGDGNEIAVYADRSDIPAATRQALARIVNARRHLQNLTEQAAAADARIAGIGREQDRIRKNMAALDRTSPLYRRYMAELDIQETQIGTLRGKAQRLRAQSDAARTALRGALDTLEIGG